MNYSIIFIERFISEIPEMEKLYIIEKEICENLAYPFCDLVLIPFMEDKISRSEFEDIETIFHIVDKILYMNNDELTNIVYAGILESTIPDREFQKKLEKYMSQNLLALSKEHEKKLGW